MKAYLEQCTSELLRTPTFTELYYARTYRPVSLILFFFLFSSVGWIWEVFLHFVADGTLVNRGILTGPWLPIYGAGSVLVLVLLKRWRDRPLHLFGLIMLLSGLIQYFTSLVMETIFDARWWDYSDMLFHVNGRICLESLLIFGLCGLIFTYILAPKLEDFLLTVSLRMRLILCTVSGIIFLLDLIHSCVFPNVGPGITL